VAQVERHEIAQRPRAQRECRDAISIEIELLEELQLANLGGQL
jgi:hypothetical protein